ncbi:MAG: CopG family transcriptional regulator [Clostridiales bacterium]|nr:CopG family transcriptional regulator [Clostridiales bacterium]
MSITLNINAETTEAIKSFASRQGLTVDEYLNMVISERLEDEYDLQCAEEALREYREDPTTYTLEEVAKHLGIAED